MRSSTHAANAYPRRTHEYRAQIADPPSSDQPGPAARILDQLTADAAESRTSSGVVFHRKYDKLLAVAVFKRRSPISGSGSPSPIEECGTANGGKSIDQAAIKSSRTKAASALTSTSTDNSSSASSRRHARSPKDVKTKQHSRYRPLILAPREQEHRAKRHFHDLFSQRKGRSLILFYAARGMGSTSTDREQAIGGRIRLQSWGRTRPSPFRSVTDYCTGPRQSPKGGELHSGLSAIEDTILTQPSPTCLLHSLYDQRPKVPIRTASPRALCYRKCRAGGRLAGLACERVPLSTAAHAASSSPS